MTRKSEGTLYETWRERWQPRASRPRVILAWLVATLIVGAMVMHWVLVVSPQRTADLEQLNLPHRPWYLLERPPLVAKAVGAEPLPVGNVEARRTNPVAGQSQLLSPRPNLVPQAGDWDAERLRRAVLAHLTWQAQRLGRAGYEPDTEASAVAQELAERCAAAGPEAINGQCERDMLAEGWLWEIWRGCEPAIYLGFPRSQIEAMGCGLQVLPAGKTLGLGVGRWRGSRGESAPVFAVVWRGGEEKGETR